MQRSSAIPTVGLSSWTGPLHRRCEVIPAQANGLGFVSEDNTRAEGPIYPLGVEKRFGLSALENPLVPLDPTPHRSLLLDRCSGIIAFLLSAPCGSIRKSQTERLTSPGARSSINA
jgi:hypothetical protein